MSLPARSRVYRDMAPARWTVTDAAGKQLAGDRLPLDGKLHPIQVKGPGAGLYYLEFNDSTASARQVFARPRIDESLGPRM